MDTNYKFDLLVMMRKRSEANYKHYYYTRNFLPRTSKKVPDEELYIN